MSFGFDLQREGIVAQESVDAEWFVVVTGKAATTKFKGIYNPVPPLDPNMPLGSDIREFATLEVLNENYPTDLESQDEIKKVVPQVGDDTDPGAATAPTPPIWSVVRRENDPGDPCVRLWLVKIVPEDQQ